MAPVRSIPNILSESKNIELPNELWAAIFTKLEPLDLMQASKVSKQWKHLSGYQKLWDELIEKVCQNYKLVFRKNQVEEDDIKLEEKSEAAMQIFQKRISSNFQCYSINKLCHGSLYDIHQLICKGFGYGDIEAFHTFAAYQREKMVLYPEYLLSNSNAVPVSRLDVLKLYIDLGEESLAIKGLKLDNEEKTDVENVEVYIIQRILDKGCFTLVASNLHEYNIPFEKKKDFIHQIINHTHQLPWLQRHKIMSCLSGKLLKDEFLSSEEKQEIAEIPAFKDFQVIPVFRNWPIQPYRSLGLCSHQKVINYALFFFRTTSFVAGGLAACLLARGLMIHNIYLSTLSLKVFAVAGLCLLGAKLVSEIDERFWYYNVNDLLEQALHYSSMSKNYEDWKDKLSKNHILRPLLNKACQITDIPYKRHFSNGAETEAEAFEIFYALHFACDQFATQKGASLSQSEKANLIKLSGFLEQGHLASLEKVFLERDSVLKGTGLFSTQKKREALTVQKTQEAVRIYEIKKLAQKIGVVFSEETHFDETHKEIVLGIAKAITAWRPIEDNWIKDIDKNILPRPLLDFVYPITFHTDKIDWLKPLLQLIHRKLPPNYRCPISGNFLNSAVSVNGFSYHRDTQIAKMKEKNPAQTQFYFEDDYHVSWQIFRALISLFEEYKKRFELNADETERIDHCLTFLFNKIDGGLGAYYLRVKYEKNFVSERNRFFAYLRRKNPGDKFWDLNYFPINT